MLNQLQLTNFRNIETLCLEPSPEMTLLYGENGSGKTSILEAIYYLSVGRSFRTRHNNRIVREGADSFIIFGELHSEDVRTTIGIEKSLHGAGQMRVNYTPVKTIAELARLMPAQFINPDSYQLLTDGPKHRRFFMDWGLFHVKHSFMDIWQKHKRVLSQRNAAIKSLRPENEIILWDEEYISLSETIHKKRGDYIHAFQPLFLEILREFTHVPDIQVIYKRGWSQGKDLVQCLEESLAKDRERGYTFYGPQRGDIQITVEGKPVQDILSRGQQKALVYAMHLAQGMLLYQQSQKACLYLLDDLPSELDTRSCRVLFGLLDVLPSQIFITGVHRDQLNQVCPQDSGHEMFHVKHGEVKFVEQLEVKLGAIS